MCVYTRGQPQVLSYGHCPPYFEVRSLLGLWLDNWLMWLIKLLGPESLNFSCTGITNLSHHSQLYYMGPKDLAEVLMLAWQAFYQLEYLLSPCQFSFNEAVKNV